MMDFVLSGPNQPFAVALSLMIAIGLLELLSLVAGSSLSEAIEQWIPDGVADSTHAPDADAGGALGWLSFGRVPLLILLVVFLTAFGLSGLALQALAQAVAGAPLPAAAASLPAAVAGLFGMRWGGRLLARILPQDETYVVSADEMVGRLARVTLGVARIGQPAEARLRDRHGRRHYVRVVPETPGLEFPTGSAVVIVERAGAVFKAIPAPPALASVGRRGD